MTISSMVEVSVVRLGICREKKQGVKQYYSCWSQDEIFGVWTHLDLPLALTGSPSLTAFWLHTPSE